MAVLGNAAPALHVSVPLNYLEAGWDLMAGGTLGLGGSTVVAVVAGVRVGPAVTVVAAAGELAFGFGFLPTNNHVAKKQP